MFVRLLAIAALLATFATPCWAQGEGKKDGDPKPQPRSQKWYSDCPSCATTLGKGGRAGPYPTVEECREKVAKLVALGYPYGFCRLEQ